MTTRLTATAVFGALLWVTWTVSLDMAHKWRHPGQALLLTRLVELAIACLVTGAVLCVLGLTALAVVAVP